MTLATLRRWLTILAAWVVATTCLVHLAGLRSFWPSSGCSGVLLGLLRTKPISVDAFRAKRGAHRGEAGRAPYRSTGPPPAALLCYLPCARDRQRGAPARGQLVLVTSQSIRAALQSRASTSGSGSWRRSGHPRRTPLIDLSSSVAGTASIPSGLHRPEAPRIGKSCLLCKRARTGARPARCLAALGCARELCWLAARGICGWAAVRDRLSTSECGPNRGACRPGAPGLGRVGASTVGTSAPDSR